MPNGNEGRRVASDYGKMYHQILYIPRLTPGEHVSRGIR